MASELVEYFVRHYTLVIDNTQDSYVVVNEIVRDYFRGQDITLGEYRALSGQERADRFASDLGDLVITQIQDWFEVTVPDSQASIGAQLASEVMIFGDSEVEWALGDHYMPDPDDLVDVLMESEDEDDEG